MSGNRACVGPSALWGVMAIVVVPLVLCTCCFLPLWHFRGRSRLCGLLFEIEVIQVGHANGGSDPSLFSLSGMFWGCLCFNTVYWRSSDQRQDLEAEAGSGGHVCQQPGQLWAWFKKREAPFRVLVPLLGSGLHISSSARTQANVPLNSLFSSHCWPCTKGLGEAKAFCALP